MVHTLHADSVCVSIWVEGDKSQKGKYLFTVRFGIWTAVIWLFLIPYFGQSLHMMQIRMDAIHLNAYHLL